MRKDVLADMTPSQRWKVLQLWQKEAEQVKRNVKGEILNLASSEQFQNAPIEKRHELINNLREQIGQNPLFTEDDESRLSKFLLKRSQKVTRDEGHWSQVWDELSGDRDLSTMQTGIMTMLRSAEYVGRKALPGVEDEWEDTFYSPERLKRGVSKFGEQWHKLADTAASAVDVGEEGGLGSQLTYEAIRRTPELVSASAMLPGLVENRRVSNWRDPDTWGEQLAGQIGQAGEFFAGLRGIGKLMGAGNASSALTNIAKRSVAAGIIPQLQAGTPSVKEALRDAGIYFGLMGASAGARRFISAGIKKLPVGGAVTSLNEGGVFQKAIGNILNKGGKTAKHLFIDRADDWIESVAESAYYASTQADDEQGWAAGFLSALPSSLFVNYITESVGEYPSGLAGHIQSNRQIERVRKAQLKKFEGALRRIKESGRTLDISDEGRKALRKLYDVYQSPKEFRKMFKGEPGFDKAAVDKATSKLLQYAELARREEELAEMGEEGELEQAQTLEKHWERAKKGEAPPRREERRKAQREASEALEQDETKLAQQMQNAVAEAQSIEELEQKAGEIAVAEREPMSERESELPSTIFHVTNRQYQGLPEAQPGSFSIEPRGQFFGATEVRAKALSEAEETGEEWRTIKARPTPEQLFVVSENWQEYEKMENEAIANLLKKQDVPLEEVTDEKGELLDTVYDYMDKEDVNDEVANILTDRGYDALWNPQKGEYIALEESAVSSVQETTEREPEPPEETTAEISEREIQERREEEHEEKPPPGGLSIQHINHTVEDKKERYVPERKELQDQIEQAREAPEPTVLQRVGEWLKDQYDNFFTRFEHLDETEENAEAIAWLRRVQAVSPFARRMAEETTRDITNPLRDKPRAYSDFQYFILFRDLAHMVDKGQELPFGLTAEEVRKENERIIEHLKNVSDEQRNAVKEAYQRHVQLAQKTGEELVERGILKTERAIENPSYFHHRVIEYAANEAFEAGDRKWRPTRGGYTKVRRGSNKAIVTDYLNAMQRYYSLAYRDMEMQNIWRGIEETADVRPELAGVINDIAETDNYMFTGSAEDTAFTDEEIEALESAVEMEKQKLQREKEELLDQAAQMEQQDQEAQAEALRAEANRKTFTLSRSRMARIVNAALPEWDIYQPESSGNHDHQFFTTWSASERLIEKAFEEGLGVPVDKLRRVLAMGDIKPFAVLSKQLSDQLNEFYSDIHGISGITEADRQVITAWKKWVLMNPWRVAKYNLRNTWGDLDGAILADHGILKHIPKAWNKAWGEFYQKKPLDDEMKEMLRQGIVQAGFVGSELGPEMQKTYRQLKKLEGVKPENMGQVRRWWRQWFSKAGKGTQWRESILRIAAWYRMKERVQRGESPHGVTKWEIAEGIENKDNLIGQLARDALGDYGSLSKTGQEIRAHLIPFWSWKEIVWKRHINAFRNAWKEANSPDSPWRGRGKAMRLIALRTFRMALMSGIAQIWNWTFFPEQERKLTLEDQLNVHINLPSPGDTPWYFRSEGSADEFLAYFGIQRLIPAARDYTLGRGSWQNALKEMVLAPTNDMIQGFGPYKSAAEIVLGKTAYPKVSEPREIHDRLRALAKVFELDQVYDLMTGEALEGQGSRLDRIIHSSIRDLVVYERDINQYHYWANEDRKREFLEREYFTEQKDEALYRFRQALKARDRQALVYAAQDLIALAKLGVWDFENLPRSIRSMHPLSHMNREKRSHFVRTATDSERKHLIGAIKRYRNTYLGWEKRAREAFTEAASTIQQQKSWTPEGELTEWFE